MAYSLVQELSEEWIGSGKIKMGAMVKEEKLTKCKIGLQQVLAQLLMSFGTMVPKIYIELDFKEWLATFNFYYFIAFLQYFINSNYSHLLFFPC